jgi:glutathione peroxidase
MIAPFVVLSPVIVNRRNQTMKPVLLAAFLSCSLLTGGLVSAEEAQETPDSVLDFKMVDIKGEEVELSAYEGQVLLLVNVASKCGLTPQYSQLVELDKKYREKGLRILGFPANNFMGQEPGTNEEIQTFCVEEYNVDFDMFAKISVKGDDIHPLYAFLTEEATNPEFSGEIGWNFAKFLVDREGKVIGRFDPRTKPDAEEVVTAIEAALTPDEPAESPEAK